MARRNPDGSEPGHKTNRRVVLPNALKGPANWHNVDPICLYETVESVTNAGGAIRFGYTRDGGAFAIGVYGDGDSYTVYCSPNEDIHGVLAAIGAGFDKPNGNGH